MLYISDSKKDIFDIILGKKELIIKKYRINKIKIDNNMENNTKKDQQFFWKKFSNKYLIKLYI